jgi:hypothetical protein
MILDCSVVYSEMTEEADVLFAFNSVNPQFWNLVPRILRASVSEVLFC